MTGMTLILILGIAIIFLAWPKAARLLGKVVESGVEHSLGLKRVIWYLTVLALAIGFGAWAERIFWKTIPKRDYSFGGFIFVLLAVALFPIAAGIAAVLLTYVGRALGNWGRLAGGVLSGVLLFVGFIQPIHHENLIAARHAESDEAAELESNIAALQAEMATTPHALPDIVPSELEVRREDKKIIVANRSNKALLVNVLLVLPQGRQWERCWTGVSQENCDPNSSGCPYQLAKDGSRIAVSGVMSIDMQPVIAPGATAEFSNRCDDRFSTAQMEFRVSDPYTGKTIFKSESAFVPESRGVSQ